MFDNISRCRASYRSSRDANVSFAGIHSSTRENLDILRSALISLVVALVRQDS